MKNCDSCNNCNNTYNCSYCNNCDSCSYCKYCNNCDSCSYCNNCNGCDYCHCCNYCKNLKMTEYNLFCWSESFGDENSFQKKPYRVFNVEISKEEHKNIKIPNHKLQFDINESRTTRFYTAFKKMRDGLTQEQKQEFYDIPHFNWEGFTYITGIKKEEDKKIVTDENGNKYYLQPIE